jgi:hypothetical protein
MVRVEHIMQSKAIRRNHAIRRNNTYMSMDWSGQCNEFSEIVGQYESCIEELHLESTCCPYSEDQLPAQRSVTK